MHVNRRGTMLAADSLVAFTTVVAAPVASGEPPRPGCGYGDRNTMHGAPPGHDADDGGLQGSHHLGCADSTLG